MLTTPENMPCLALLVGGLATRLHPLTEKIPKSLIEIAGEPFLAHQLRLIQRQGIKKVMICAGHMEDQIRDYAGDGSKFGVALDYSRDGDTLLGTGGAIRKALPMLGNEFFVMYGDAYLPTDFALVADFFHSCGKPALMTVYQNKEQWESSNVIFRNGEVVLYDKRKNLPDMHHIEYGLGTFRASAFAAVSKGAYFDLAEIYHDLILHGQLAGYEVKERFYDIGTYEGIRTTEAYLSQRATI